MWEDIAGLLQFREMREASDSCHTGRESGYCSNDPVFLEWKMEPKRRMGCYIPNQALVSSPSAPLQAENTWGSQETKNITLKQQDEYKNRKIHNINLEAGGGVGLGHRECLRQIEIFKFQSLRQSWFGCSSYENASGWLEYWRIRLYPKKKKK